MEEKLVKKISIREKARKNLKNDNKSDNKIGLEELDFSVRTYNRLKRAGKNTLQDLLDMTEEEFLKVRNLGEKGAKEVLSKIALLKANDKQETIIIKNN